MSRIDEMNNMFEQLEGLSEKYKEYKPVATTQIKYHDPENEEQRQKANSISKSNMFLLYLISAIFVAAFILTIITNKDFGAMFLMFVITAIVVAITLLQATKKVKVITGTAVYKGRAAHRPGKRSALYIYYISMIPDNGEKVIYGRIQVSEEDYNKITEGTRVMVVNKGTRACVL